MDESANLKNQWFGRTVTYSDERFAYGEAQHIIETQEGDIPKEVSIRDGAYSVSASIVEAVLTLDRLAKIMRTKRMDAGAISFDKIEVKFNLDESNEPEGVYFKEAKDANKLIEEFMLLANRKVAEYIGKKKKTFVYRVHDEPDEEKLMALNGVILRFGHSLNLRDKKSVNSSLNQLLQDVRGKKEQNLVDTLAIRSMSKAIYTTDNIGHYGLDTDCLAQMHGSDLSWQHPLSFSSLLTLNLPQHSTHHEFKRRPYWRMEVIDNCTYIPELDYSAAALLSFIPSLHAAKMEPIVSENL